MNFLKRNILAIGAMLPILAAAPSARACSVCFGGADSNVNQAMSMAILFMLGILVVVLGMFVGFFLYLWKKASAPEPDHAPTTL